MESSYLHFRVINTELFNIYASSTVPNHASSSSASEKDHFQGFLKLNSILLYHKYSIKYFSFEAFNHF